MWCELGAGSCGCLIWAVWRDAAACSYAWRVLLLICVHAMDSNIGDMQGRGTHLSAALLQRWQCGCLLELWVWWLNSIACRMCAAARSILPVLHYLCHTWPLLTHNLLRPVFAPHPAAAPAHPGAPAAPLGAERWRCAPSGGAGPLPGCAVCQPGVCGGGRVHPGRAAAASPHGRVMPILWLYCHAPSCATACAGVCYMAGCSRRGQRPLPAELCADDRNAR